MFDAIIAVLTGYVLLMAFGLLIRYLLNTASEQMRPRGLSVEAVNALREYQEFYVRNTPEMLAAIGEQEALSRSGVVVGIDPASAAGDAGAICTIQDGVITSVVLTSAGAGYTTAPIWASTVAHTLTMADTGYNFYAWGMSASDTHNRSIALLKDWLSPDQLASYEAHNNFIVTSNTGNRYRINYGMTNNVDRLNDAGETVASLCFQPAGCASIGDTMLAQKVMLETDEAAALRVANLMALSNVSVYADLVRATADAIDRQMRRAMYSGPSASELCTVVTGNGTLDIEGVLTYVQR